MTQEITIAIELLNLSLTATEFEIFLRQLTKKVERGYSDFERHEVFK